MRIHPSSFGFIVLCGALTAFPSLSIDIGLPAFPEVGRALGVSSERVALTLTVFFIGFAAAPLFYGPLSDRIGRRPVLIAACTGYAVTSLLCMGAHSLSALLWWRLAQGTSAGAASVLAMSIIRDHFQGAEARRLLSYAAIVRLIAPMIGPAVGAGLLTLGNWRWIYGFMGLGGLAMLLVIVLGFEESVKRQTHDAIVKPSILHGFKVFLSNPVSCAYAMIVAFAFGSHFSYVTGSSFVFIESLNVSRGLFTGLFGMAAACLMIGSMASGKLNKRGVSGQAMIAAGLIVSTTSALCMTLLAAADWLSVGRVAFLLCCNTFCFGLITPNAQQAALEPSASTSGTASALMNATMTGMGALASYLVQALTTVYHAGAMTGLMALFSVLSALTFLWIRRYEQTRPGPAAHHAGPVATVAGDAVPTSKPQ